MSNCFYPPIWISLLILASSWLIFLIHARNHFFTHSLSYSTFSTWKAAYWCVDCWVSSGGISSTYLIDEWLFIYQWFNVFGSPSSNSRFCKRTFGTDISAFQSIYCSRWTHVASPPIGTDSKVNNIFMLNPFSVWF